MVTPQRQTRESRRRHSTDSIVEDLPHLASASLGGPVPVDSSVQAVSKRGPQSETERLRADLDVVELKLLAALDSVKGAEAERATALGHVKDVEFKLHLAEAEVESLKRELAAERAQNVSLRHMTARRARDLLRNSLSWGQPGGR